MRTRCIIAVLPMLAACASAGGPLGFNRWPTVLPRQDAIAGAVDAAHAQLDSAAQRGDTAALRRLFDPGAVVVIEAGTLRGFDALAASVAGAYPGTTGGGVELHPNRTEWCTDGAYEVGGTAILVARRGDGRADTLQPNYAVRWLGTGPGAARIVALTLQRQGLQREVRASGCRVYLGPARYSQRRFFVLIEPFLGISRLETFQSATKLLLDHGYVVPGPLQAEDPQTGQIGLFPKSEQANWRLSVSARARVLGPLSVEAVLSPIGTRGTVTGHSAADTSYAILSVRPMSAAFLVGLEWRRLRISAGPVLVHAAWSLEERQLRWAQAVERWYGPVRTDADWGSTATGTLVQAAYTWAFSSSAFAEIRWSWRTVTLDFASPSTVFPSGKLDAGGSELMLGIGVAW